MDGQILCSPPWGSFLSFNSFCLSCTTDACCHSLTCRLKVRYPKQVTHLLDQHWFFFLVFFLTGQLKHSFINRTTNKHSSGMLVNLGPNEVIWNALSSLPLWSVPACKSHELMLNVPRRYKMCSRFNAMNADEFTQVLMEKRFDTNENRETLELNSDQQHTTFVLVFFWFLSSQ